MSDKAVPCVVMRPPFFDGRKDSSPRRISPPHTLHSSRKPRFQGPLALGLRPPKAFLEKAAIIAINLFRRQIAVFRRGLRLASRCPRSQPLHHGAGASSAELFPPAGFFRLPQVLFLNPRALSAERRYLCKKNAKFHFFFTHSFQFPHFFRYIKLYEQKRKQYLPHKAGRGASLHRRLYVLPRDEKPRPLQGSHRAASWNQGRAD